MGNFATSLGRRNGGVEVVDFSSNNAYKYPPKTGKIIMPSAIIFLSLYTARPSFEYYRQVYFVHSGLQDESLQVTISKLP